MCVVCLLANILKEFDAIAPLNVEVPRPRAFIRAWILDCDFVFDDGGIDPVESFNRMHLIGVWKPAALEPEVFIEADRIDDKSVIFPPSDRMSVVCRLEIAWMRTTIHINGSERVRTADIENQKLLKLGYLDKLDAIWR